MAVSTTNITLQDFQVNRPPASAVVPADTEQLGSGVSMIKLKSNGVLVVPTINTACLKLDSGNAGFVFRTADSLRERSATRQHCDKLPEQDVERQQ